MEPGRAVRLLTTLVLIAAGAVAFRMAVVREPATAFAHHGWAWTENEPFELSGTIEDIYIGNPHVTLKVRAEDGIWHVDLAPLAATLRAGFDENAAAAGDTATVIGFRSRTHGEMSMKAARIVVNGETYDVYPNRVPEM
jgi:hypothetical protein